LGDEALASIIIGLSDTTALVLGLVATVEGQNRFKEMGTRLQTNL